MTLKDIRGLDFNGAAAMAIASYEAAIAELQGCRGDDVAGRRRDRDSAGIHHDACVECKGCILPGSTNVRGVLPGPENWPQQLPKIRPPAPCVGRESRESEPGPETCHSFPTH